MCWPPDGGTTRTCCSLWCSSSAGCCEAGEIAPACGCQQVLSRRVEDAACGPSGQAYGADRCCCSEDRDTGVNGGIEANVGLTCQGGHGAIDANVGLTEVANGEILWPRSNRRQQRWPYLRWPRSNTALLDLERSTTWNLSLCRSRSLSWNGRRRTREPDVASKTPF